MIGLAAGAVAAGFLLGFLLFQLSELTGWVVDKLLKPQEDRITTSSGRRESSLLRFPVFGLALFFVALPSLLFFSLADLPTEEAAAKRLAILYMGAAMAGMLASMVKARLSPQSDPIELAVSKRDMPVVAVFGRFRNEDDQLREFMDLVTGPKSMRKLWSKVENLAIDLDDDGWLLEKYGVDAAQGLQVMVFLKNGEKVDFDGKDRLFLDDVRSPGRLEERFQLVMDRGKTLRASVLSQK